jgi:L-cysteine desulfidase
LTDALPRIPGAIELIMSEQAGLDCAISDEGLVKDDVEGIIVSVGRMGSAGMKGTDEEIL